MGAAIQNAEFIDLIAGDWEGNQEAVLERVPRNLTIGEVVTTSADVLQLPFADFFQAVLRGRELNHGDTLDEAGVENDDKIELVPGVSAGARG
jgi:hypothetical protein